MGVKLFPKDEHASSPTVTAAYVPSNWTWDEFDSHLRANGLVVGGSYGPMAGKVFRIGHMGSQTDLKILQAALDVIEHVITKI